MQAKQPDSEKTFSLNDSKTKQNISRVFKLLDGWKSTQVRENAEIICNMQNDIQSADNLIEKLTKEINNRKIYGNRPPSRIRNRLKELNLQVKNKSINN